MSVKILIADDHPLFRAAMCHALTSVEHLELVETSSFPSTLSHLEKDQDIDLLFLDLTMPGNEEIKGLAQVHALYPDVLVVVITAQEEEKTSMKSTGRG